MREQHPGPWVKSIPGREWQVQRPESRGMPGETTDGKGTTGPEQKEVGAGRGRAKRATWLPETLYCLLETQVQPAVGI